MSNTTGMDQPSSGRSGLKKRLILSMMLVGVLPLLIGQIMGFWQGTQEIREVNGESFKALAIETARKIDMVLLEEEMKTQQIAEEPEIVAALESRRDTLSTLPQSDLEQLITEETEAWTNQDPTFMDTKTQGSVAHTLRRYYNSGIERAILGDPDRLPVTRSATRALFITDSAGSLVATLHTNVPYAHQHTNWWQKAFHKGVGQTHWGHVAFAPQLKTQTFTLSVPIFDSIRYQAIGVLHRVYDAKEFFTPSIETITFGETGQVMLVDSAGRVMSCPELPTGAHLNNPELLTLVTPHQAGWTLTPGNGHGETETSLVGFAPLPGVLQSALSSSETTWHIFVWKSNQELFAPIQQYLIWITVFGLVALGLMVGLGFMVANKIVTPIRHLQAAAHRIGGGEFHEPISITTGDEIEDLAEEFNQMSTQLQLAFGGLQSEVRSKTIEVQQLRESTSGILDSVPAPVIMVNAQEEVQYMNQASKDIFAIHNGLPQPLPFFSLFNIDNSVKERLHQEIQQLGDATENPQSPSDSPKLTESLKDSLAQHLRWNPSQEKVLEVNNRCFRYEWFTVKTQATEQPWIGMVMQDETEDHRLQHQLAHHEKITGLEILCSGIGHELNNPLTAIIGLGEVIQEEHDPTQVKQYAKDMTQHGQRMATIIQKVTGNIQGQAERQVVPVSLNEELTQAWDWVLNTSNASQVNFHTDLHALPNVMGQSEEIRQAMIYVMNNAVQAMKGKGRLSVSTNLINGQAVVSIQDSGPGISKNDLAKIFDPFFTTKAQGEGTGLGLNIVRRILGRHGGQVDMVNTEPHGVLCTLTFPTESMDSQSEIMEENYHEP
jgi:signal transduction histidine kinase